MFDKARIIGENAGEPQWVIDKRIEAENAIQNAPFPEFIKPVKLEKYDPVGKGDVELPDIKDINNIPDEIKNMLLKMGIPEQEWPLVLGMIQVDTGSSTNSFRSYFEKMGIKVLPLREALRTEEDIQDYAFKLMPIYENKIVAYHTAYWNGGVYVRIGKGAKVPQPLHTYFLIT